jgi:hypothetical protein
MALYELLAGDQIGRMVELENVPDWVVTRKRQLNVQCLSCGTPGQVSVEEVHVEDSASGVTHRFVEIDRGAGFDHECRPKRADGSQ